MCAELQISWSRNHFLSILVGTHIQSICNKSIENLWAYTLPPVLPECRLRHPPSILPVMHQTTLWICVHSVGPLYLAKEKAFLEAVQKFACKVCCKNWNMDYESMLAHLNIPSLQQRRLQLKANMMHQFVCDVHPPSNYDTQNISYFSVPYARTMHSFFPHMLRFWNSLPPTVGTE